MYNIQFYPHIEPFIDVYLVFSIYKDFSNEKITKTAKMEL